MKISSIICFTFGGLFASDSSNSPSPNLGKTVILDDDDDNDDSGPFIQPPWAWPGFYYDSYGYGNPYGGSYYGDYNHGYWNGNRNGDWSRNHNGNHDDRGGHGGGGHGR